MVVTSGAYLLAIDYGTTASVAAVSTGDRPELVVVGSSPRVPSSVLCTEDGRLVAGEAALQQAAAAPGRVEWAPKRRLGDRTVLLGGQAVSPVDLVTATLSIIAEEVLRQHGGRPPDEVRLSYPARWAGTRTAALAEAAHRAGLGQVHLVPEPVAAAIQLDADQVAAGAFVAVFDLGGGTLDTAVLRRVADGFELAGVPGGIDRLGGEDFDERLYVHVGELIGHRQPDAWEQLRFGEDRSWQHLNHGLRAQVRAAKEALSTASDHALYVGPPVDLELRVTRDELERLIAGDVRRAVDELMATLDRAGVAAGELAAVYLVGGSSRVPLVARELAERTGQVPVTWGDPKAVVALGAASAAPAMLVGSPGGAALPPPPVATSGVVPDMGTGGGPAAWAVAGPTAVGRPPGLEPGSPPIGPEPDAGTRAGGAARPAARGRSRQLVAAAVVVAAVIGSLAGLVAARVGGDDDRVIATTPAVGTSIPVAAEDLVVEPFAGSLPGGIERSDSLVLQAPDGDALGVDVALRNATTNDLVVQHIEVVPKEWAATVDDVDFGIEPTRVIDEDPVVSWDVPLGPGEEVHLTYEVAVPEGQDFDEEALADLAAAREAATDDFLANDPWVDAFEQLIGADLVALTWGVEPAAVPTVGQQDPDGGVEVVDVPVVDNGADGDGDDDGGAGSTVDPGTGVLVPTQPATPIVDPQTGGQTPVTPANGAPTIAAIGTITSGEAEARSVAFVVNDPEGEALTCRLVGGVLPTGVTVSGCGLQGTVDGNAAPGNGDGTPADRTYDFTIQVSDAKGAVATAGGSWTVQDTHRVVGNWHGCWGPTTSTPTSQCPQPPTPELSRVNGNGLNCDTAYDSKIYWQSHKPGEALARSTKVTFRYQNNAISPSTCDVSAQGWP